MNVERSSSQLLLQDTALGYAWTLALSVAEGALAATIAGRDQVVVLFGACTLFRLFGKPAWQHRQGVA